MSSLPSAVKPLVALVTVGSPIAQLHMGLCSDSQQQGVCQKQIVMLAASSLWRCFACWRPGSSGRGRSRYLECIAAQRLPEGYYQGRRNSTGRDAQNGKR